MPPPGHLFPCDYRCQQTPGNAPSTVRFDVRGLVVDFRDGSPARVWPYASLGSNAAIPIANSSRVVLTSTADPNATLSVNSPEFVTSLLQAAPQLKSKAARGPSWMPMVLATVGLLAVIGGLIWTVLAVFPYKTVAKRIPEETRASIGKLALAELTKGHKQCQTPTGSAALSRLVDRLSKASGTDIKFKVQVVDWSLVNAFAVMGNQIVLTKGLLQKASHPDEVAGVLGHEMGHAIEVHPEAAVLRALGTVIGVQVLLGGWSPDLVTQAASQLLLLRHSRSAETEADEVALRMLKAASIAPGPFAGFFDKISKPEEEKKGKDKGYKIPDVFQTHPPPPERAARARAQPAYSATPALDDTDWQALRRICG